MTLCKTADCACCAQSGPAGMCRGSLQAAVVSTVAGRVLPCPVALACMASRCRTEATSSPPPATVSCRFLPSPDAAAAALCSPRAANNNGSQAVQTSVSQHCHAAAATRCNDPMTHHLDAACGLRPGRVRADSGEFAIMSASVRCTE